MVTSKDPKYYIKLVEDNPTVFSKLLKKHDTFKEVMDLMGAGNPEEFIEIFKDDLEILQEVIDDNLEFFMDLDQEATTMTSDSSLEDAKQMYDSERERLRMQFEEMNQVAEGVEELKDDIDVEAKRAEEIKPAKKTKKVAKKAVKKKAVKKAVKKTVKKAAKKATKKTKKK